MPNHNGQSDAVDVEGGTHSAAAASPGSSKHEAEHCTCSACSNAARKRRTCCAGKTPQCRGPRARDGARNAAYYKVLQPAHSWKIVTARSTGGLANNSMLVERW